jgi:hypothetical protein
VAGYVRCYFWLLALSSSISLWNASISARILPEEGSDPFACSTRAISLSDSSAIIPSGGIPPSEPRRSLSKLGRLSSVLVRRDVVTELDAVRLKSMLPLLDFRLGGGRGGGEARLVLFAEVDDICDEDLSPGRGGKGALNPAFEMLLESVETVCGEFMGILLLLPKRRAGGGGGAREDNRPSEVLGG